MRGFNVAMWLIRLSEIGNQTAPMKPEDNPRSFTLAGLPFFTTLVDQRHDYSGFNPDS